MTSLPRPGTVVYDLNHGSVKQQNRAISKFRILNMFLFIPFYTIGLLPLLGFSRIFLLLYTTGRRSGKKRTTPLEYHRINGIIHIFSARGVKSDWLKNLLKSPDKASVKLGFHYYKPKIKIIYDTREKLEVIKWYVTNHPNFAKYLMGWNKEMDDPESDILNPLAEFLQIIKLYVEK